VPKKRSVVLLVENDREVRERVGGWLREDGFGVLTCPGPLAPDYVCAGARAPCPLVRAADLIVLDLWLSSDRAMIGIPSQGLLGRYLSAQKPVLAFTHRQDELPHFLEENLAEMQWPPDRRETLETVRARIADEASS
jgi:DNA-binding response OmpR family regulator